MRVLIVDDDPTLLMMMRLILRRAGHEVIEASDGTEGIAAFRAGRPDVLVCDLYMPGVNGLEMLRTLGAELAGVRIVLASGGDPASGFSDLPDRAAALGAACLLEKPFAGPELLAAISAPARASNP